MPLTMLTAGVENRIKRVTGTDETKKFLENLGFVVGANVTVVSEIAGSMIINVKDSRIAIDKAMACRIIV